MRLGCKEMRNWFKLVPIEHVVQRKVPLVCDYHDFIAVISTAVISCITGACLQEGGSITKMRISVLFSISDEALSTEPDLLRSMVGLTQLSHLIAS